MKSNLRKPLLLLAFVLVSAAAVSPRPAHSQVRYCCTPQQISDCTARGGTTSCRTNVCQCLF